MIERIIKRDGTFEDFSPRKLNGWGEWASKTLGSDVSWSEVVLHVASTSNAEITSKQLQQAFIDYCLTKRSFAYNRMAGRLYISMLYKDIYNDKLPTLYEMLSQLAERGLASQSFVNSFTQDEYEELNNILDHKSDLNYAHYQIEQAMEKYSLRDRVKGGYLETPQYSAMRVAMQMCKNRKNRIERIKRHYNKIRSDVLNVPTPYYTNSGTDKLGLASCCLHESDDFVGSLAAGNHISYMMTVNSAGQGTKIRTRTVDDPVRGGTIPHQGKKPYLRAEVGMINANLQNGRGGAETTSFDIIDPEIKELLVLKNPMTPSARQIRGLDYSVGFSKYFAKKAANNEDWVLFSYADVPDLYEAMYATDDTFKRLYEDYVKQGKGRETVKARDVLRLMLTEGVGVGRIYQENLFEMNYHTPFKTDGNGKIRQSNLCVAPETEILTINGYQIISELEDQEVDVWNGKEWSTTVVRKTSPLESVVSVDTDDGATIDCTKYHKWYVVKRDKSGKLRGVIEKRTHELQAGDELIKSEGYDTVLHGYARLDFPYESGFVTGDGCERGRTDNKGLELTLYKQSNKFFLKDVLKGYSSSTNLDDNMVFRWKYGTLLGKYNIPDSSFVLQDRLEWLAGLLDADGSALKDGESFVLNTSKKDFAQKMKLFLQEIGVDCTCGLYSNSKTTAFSKKTSNDYQEIPREPLYVVRVHAKGVTRLLDLGLSCKRLDLVKSEKSRSTSSKFVKIVSVSDFGRETPVFCFTEHKRHMGMFNGILTGQCLEIALITSTYDSVKDLYVYGDLKKAIADNAHPSVIQYLKEKNEAVKGEVAVCSLAGINVGKIKGKVGTPEWDEEYREAAFVALDMIYTAITESEYPLPHIEYTAKKRMSAGVGIVDLAHLMAKYKVNYDSQEGRDLVHKVAESHYWHLLNASLELSKEFGNAEWIDKTKWKDGWLPIDTYNKHVDEVVTVGLQYDWEGLRQRIIENGGHAFSVLAAHMPAESSSVRSGSTNGVYPIRDLDLNKTNDTNVVKYVVPESDKLGKYYQNAYDISVEDMAKVYGIIQKWTDQAISADQWYKAQGSDKIKSSELMKGWFSWVYYGVKTRYYINTLTAKGIELNVDLVEDDQEFQPEANSECEECKM